jgi:hypothetical protein
MLWKQDKVDYKEQEERVTEDSCLGVNLDYKQSEGLLLLGAASSRCLWW